MTLRTNAQENESPDGVEFLTYDQATNEEVDDTIEGADVRPVIESFNENM